MSDTFPKPQPPGVDGPEVQDWVAGPDGYLVYRQQNDAANQELLRRGQPQLVAPSGEVDPYWIVWVEVP